MTLAETDVDTFTYDLASRLLTAASGRYANTASFTHTPDSLIATEALTGTTSFPGGMTVTRGYDDADRLTTITYPSGETVTRTFTSRHQLATVTRDPDGPGPIPGLDKSPRSDVLRPCGKQAALLANGWSVPPPTSSHQLTSA